MRRRTLLAGIIVSVYTACRGKSPTSSRYEPQLPVDSAEPEECLPQELSISLMDYPELTEVDGSALVSFPDQFVHLLVVCVAVQKWIAVWKICTHGSCDVEWDENRSAIRCPCHNSFFDLDGHVLQGPAQRPLKSYTVCQLDNSLYLSSAE